MDIFWNSQGEKRDMRGWWVRFGIAGAGALVLLAGSLPTEAGAQTTERYRVMVTNLKPTEGSDDDFGKDLAKELRKLINEYPTHQPVEEGEIKDMTRQYDIDMDDLDCIRALQLATQMNVQLVFCGGYMENKETKEFSLSGVKFAAPGGTQFAIEDRTWGEKEYEAAAAEISGTFETYVTQLRHAAFCGDYYNSKDWSGAETNCLRALEMNPADTQTRLIYALVHKEQGRDQESYEEVLKVIETDPLNEDALNLAGHQAAILERPDEARQHYTRYLQLQPENAPVRMRVAYDLATAGDSEGAMLLIEEGLQLDDTNVEMLLQHASFATRAAQALREGTPVDEPLSPEVARLYRKALDSYEGAYAVQGEDMESAHLRNMIAAYFQLEQLDDAIQMAERALATHADEIQLWSLYADILKRSDRLDDAVAALGELEARDPDYPNVKARQGSWLLEAGREDDAFPYLQQAVQKGEQKADDMAMILFATAHRGGVSSKNWPYALRLIGMAKSFNPEDATAGTLDFWHGYVLYNQALEQEKPQTLQTAQASLPKFQEAARLFALGRVATYADTEPSINIQVFRDATQQYIEIQSAIIQRGN